MVRDTRTAIHARTAALMDWDKLRIFHAAAEAGSFTHASETLSMSQSAISRQVSALEENLGHALFTRHARGLILTEVGDELYKVVHDVLLRLDNVRSKITDASDKPSGLLRVTTTVGLGTIWLTSRLQGFLDLYPDVQLDLVLTDNELDLSMREADVAIRLRRPEQPDLVARKLFTVHFHVYAGPTYLKKYGTPKSLDDLDHHRIITFGTPTPSYLRDINFLETAGLADGEEPRRPHLRITNMVALRRAVQRGLGVAMLPDYLAESDSGLVQLDIKAEMPSFEGFFVYPEALRNTAKINAFRDFLVGNARVWQY